MSDLIDRNKAIEAIKADLMGGLNYESILKEMPTVDAEPVRHGVWKYGENRFGIPNWECSVCGCHGRGDYNYCPWCGANMYERKEE